MKEKKKSLKEVGYSLILRAAIIVLFQWYTTQNKNRMESRNKNYALDSARQIATRIDEELNNALEPYKFHEWIDIDLQDIERLLLLESKINR